MLGALAKNSPADIQELTDLAGYADFGYYYLARAPDDYFPRIAYKVEASLAVRVGLALCYCFQALSCFANGNASPWPAK